MFLNLAAAIFCVSCLTAAIVVCVEKWGGIVLYDTRIKGIRLGRWRIGELCYFCFCFWVSFVNVWLCFQFFDIEIYYALVPFPSAAFSLFIYANLRAKI